jgi:hypothetical protein
MKIIMINYHRNGITPDRVLCSIILEGHPTECILKAYDILVDIMPNYSPWMINEISYTPMYKDTDSRMLVTAKLKEK